MFFRCSAMIMVFVVFSNIFLNPVFAAQKKVSATDSKQVLSVMRKASDFMMNNAAYRGGFVWKYSVDLSERWGEVPARPSQIWVQGATNGVGEMFLDAWKTTGDPVYLEYARRVANAIVQGQYPEGGWHYLIDFDMSGIQKWYDDVASKCWGWEEYYHFYGNCTFDDDATASSAEYLLHYYLASQDVAFLAPLQKALDFVLEAQYPNGGWPQRYPLRYDFPHDGVADYTSYYTFNDGVIPNCIKLLMEAYEGLGDPRYYEAARRGMDFYFISQGPEEQAGWSSQYDMEMRPAQARSYEPAAWSTSGTTARIEELETFYKITGDRRYLRPIPAAIAWLERSVINTDPAKNYTHGRFLEPGTNRPLVAHRDGTDRSNGHYWYDYNLENPITHMGMTVNIDLTALKREYERVKSLTPEQAKAEYRDEQEAADHPSTPASDNVIQIINALDSRGAWITDIKVADFSDPIKKPRRELKGINVGTFISNMTILINFIKNKK